MKTMHDEAHVLMSAAYSKPHNERRGYSKLSKLINGWFKIRGGGGGKHPNI